ncbi:hypothetical protein [Pantoea ananatis]|uniref:hypothetical protein n=1 Tax=Pantoea ananas TaxID=553 RepID=UPI001B315091|nr:hypothetical protein [Pantoea ananatis]
MKSITERHTVKHTQSILKIITFKKSPDRDYPNEAIGAFLIWKRTKNVDKDDIMKENKESKITARISETQNQFIKKLIDEGKAKTPSAAIQYLINMAMIKS